MPDLVLLTFGGIFIASWFMLFSFIRMARAEAIQAHGRGLIRNRGFLLAFWLVVGAIALIGISVIRVIQGLFGFFSPALLVVSLALLWAAWSGFHWSATFDRARWHWRLYLAFATAWVIGFGWLAWAGRIHLA